MTLAVAASAHRCDHPRWTCIGRRARRGAFVVLVVLSGCFTEPPTRGADGPPVVATPAPEVLVSHIQRLPRIPNPDAQGMPRVVGWPSIGSEVTWVAHVVLRHAPPSPATLVYEWRLNGRLLKRDSLTPSAAVVEIPIRLPWSGTRDTLSIQVTAPVSWQARRTEDDGFTIFTDALSVGFWVDSAVYHWLARTYPGGFEAIARREVNHLNGMFEAAVHPATPHGVLDRVRLDAIGLRNDEDGYPRHIDTDFVWWFLRSPRIPLFLSRVSPLSVLDDQTVVLHELLHQRGIVDLYAYEVLHAASNQSRVDIRNAAGVLVAGTPQLPAIDSNPHRDGVRLFRPVLNGLMGTLYMFPTVIDEHTAWGLNLVAGRRTPTISDELGNQSHRLLNDYVDRVPTRVTFEIRDDGGQLVSNATLAVFPDTNSSGQIYTDWYASQPDTVVAIDDSGRASMPGARLFRRGRSDAAKAWTTIFRVRQGEREGYVFVPGTQFNLMVARGDSAARQQLVVRLAP